LKTPEKKQQDLFADHDFDIKIDLDVPSTGKLNFILGWSLGIGCTFNR
jgi:hypothetical protein